MKYLKTIFILGAFVLILLPLCADVPKAEDFLTTAVAVAKSTSVTPTSSVIWVAEPGYSKKVVLIFTFTRAAGSASTLDFYFEFSHDDGTTWTDYDDITEQIATNTTAYSGTTVRVMEFVYVDGMTDLRLKKITNGDATNGVTAVNVTLVQGTN